MTRWIYAAIFGAAGLVAGALIALSCYSATLSSGARTSGYVAEVTLSLVPGGMFLGGIAAATFGLWVGRRAGGQPLLCGQTGDWLDVVLGALTSVSCLPFSVWSVADLAGPLLGATSRVGGEQGYVLSGDLGLGLALLGGVGLFVRLRHDSPAFADALMATACVIAPILWGVVQVEAALPAA